MRDENDKAKRRHHILIGGSVAGVIIAMVIGMVFYESHSAKPQEKPKGQTMSLPGEVSDRDAWRAQQAAKEKANEVLIQELRQQLQAQDAKQQALREGLETLKKAPPASAPVLAQPLPSVNSPANQQILPPPGSAPLNTPLQPPMEPPRREVEIITFDTVGSPSSGEGSQQEVLGFPVDEKAKRYGATKGSAQTVEFIPAGSFVRVVMLNGMDAPTGGQAQSNPLPVAFHVLDTANLANKHRLDIRDCRVVAAAWGDLPSERMMARTETLTCLIEGESVEMTIKGQVIGEDGKAGVRGRVVTKQGQLLANALFSGALSGIGNAFQQSATLTSIGGGGMTQTIDSSQVGRAALGGGVGSAASALAQYYLKAADKLFPVIETDGGRTVEILITKGAVYQGQAKAGQYHRALLKREGSRRRARDE